MFRSKKALSLTIVLLFANVAGAQEKQPAPVDQYGDPLPPGALARIGTVRFRQTGEIHTMAFSPDGKVLATVGWRFVCLWDVATGKELQRFPAGFNANAAFSPDGKLLAVGEARRGEDDKKVCIWDIAKHQVVAELDLRRHQNVSGAVPSIAFAESGKVLRFCDVFGTFYAWDVRTGKELSPKQPENVQLSSHSAITPDGKIVAYAGFTNTTPDKRDPSITYSSVGPTYLFDLATGKKLHSLSGHKTFTFVPLLAFSPDGKILATAGYPEAPILWDVETGKLLRKLPFWGEFHPASLAFSPDGKTLAVGSGSRLGLWDVATGKRLPKFRTSLAGHCATFAPDGKTLAVADESAVRILDATSGKELIPQNEIISGIACAAWFPDGKSVALSTDGAIWRHDATTGKAITELRSNRQFPALQLFGGGFEAMQSLKKTWDYASGPSDGTDYNDRVTALAVAPDGKKLGFVHGRNVELLDPDTQESIKSIELGDQFGYGYGEFTFTGVNVGYVSIGPQIHGDKKPRQAHAWEFSTGRKRFLFECKTGTSDMAVSSDGKFLATTYSSPDFAEIRLRDQAAGKVLNDLPISKSPVGPCCFSADAKTLVAVALPRYDVKQKKRVHEDEGFIVWDVPTGKQRFRVRKAYDKILSPQIAVSPDGNLIAMEGPESTVCVFDGRTGKELRCFKGHRIWLTSLAFSPDGKMLLSASHDASALIWDVAALRK